MKSRYPIALFFIANCLILTGVQAAKVYKCGSSYSQVPCADGVELSTPTEPSAKAQRAARKVAEMDEKTANRMEKERLAAEKAALKEQHAAQKARTAEEKTAEEEKKQEAKKPKKAPEFFTAKAPGAKATQSK